MGSQWPTFAAPLNGVNGTVTSREAQRIMPLDRRALIRKVVTISNSTGGTLCTVGGGKGQLLVVLCMAEIR